MLAIEHQHANDYLEMLNEEKEERKEILDTFHTRFGIKKDSQTEQAKDVQAFGGYTSFREKARQFSLTSLQKRAQATESIEESETEVK